MIENRRLELAQEEILQQKQDEENAEKRKARRSKIRQRRKSLGFVDEEAEDP